MIEAGIPIEFSKGEAGIGQHEINITYGTALEVADRHLVFKNGVKEIAGEYGRAATFMAKWSMDTAGSSCHIHTSLWDADDRRTADGPGRRRDTPSGFSTVGAQWIAGQLHAADQLAWCFAPYVNSYRRYVPDSWAPTAVVWGEDNRTCGFRAVGHGAGRRVESRIPGADVNPYIALAAAIAGGLWGIDHGVELAPAFTGNAYHAPRCPGSPPPCPTPSPASRRARWRPRPSAPTSTSTWSTPPARNGPRPTRWSPTGSWPATSSASDRGIDAATSGARHRSRRRPPSLTVGCGAGTMDGA